MPIEPEILNIQTAARARSRRFLMVLDQEEGSTARRHVGSAFAIQHERRVAFVTAGHVVTGPTRKRLIGSGGGKQIDWPPSNAILMPRQSGLPDADVAFMTGTLHEGEDTLAAFTLEELLPNLVVRPEMRFVAIGYPASRTRVRGGNGTIQPSAFTLISDPVPVDRYEGHGLDPRVHIAVRYDPEVVVSPDGTPMQGPVLKGMSGGGLFLVGWTDDLPEETRVLFLVGILTEFHGKGSNILVATRIECLLDNVVGSTRPEGRLYDAGVVTH